MKTSFVSGLLVIIVTIGMTSLSFGAGFQVPEQGAASMGMGMGGIGKADDLSAIYHNPAGLTQLKGNNAYLSVAGIAPTATYTREGFEAQDNKDDLIPVPMLAFASDFGGRFENLVVAFGVDSPFGLRNEYDALGPQRYISTKISLATAYIGPYVAWQVTPKVSIGGGVQYVYATAEIGQKVNYGGVLYLQALQQNPDLADPRLNENLDYDGTLTIDNATEHNFSGNLGVLVKPMDNLQVGLTWRSGVDLDIEGDITLEIPTAVTQLSGGLIQSLETTGKTTVSLPQVIGIGVAYQPIENLTLIGDFNWINWSVYEDIDFDFELNTPYFPDKANPRDWDDTIAVRLGAEYWFADKYAIRAGYIFDQTPIPDESHGPELPTSNRNNITLGFGYKWNNLSLDLAYAHLFIDDRTVTESIRDPQPLGKYECAGNVFGVSVGYNF
jgi:long-chain fatty acid transport protein